MQDQTESVVIRIARSRGTLGLGHSLIIALAVPVMPGNSARRDIVWKCLHTTGTIEPIKRMHVKVNEKVERELKRISSFRKVLSTSYYTISDATPADLEAATDLVNRIIKDFEGLNNKSLETLSLKEFELVAEYGWCNADYPTKILQFDEKDRELDRFFLVTDEHSLYRACLKVLKERHALKLYDWMKDSSPTGKKPEYSREEVEAIPVKSIMEEYLAKIYDWEDEVSRHELYRSIYKSIVKAIEENDGIEAYIALYRVDNFNGRNRFRVIDPEKV